MATGFFQYQHHFEVVYFRGKNGRALSEMVED